MNATIGMGHNQGPPFDEALLAELTDLAKKQAAAGDAWNAAPPVEDEATEGKLADYLSGLGASIKRIEDARKAAKQPHLDAGKAVDDAFNPLKKALEARQGAVKWKLGEWLKVKKQRQEAEARAAREAAQTDDAVEAERKAAAAAVAQKAAAKAAEPVKTQAKSGTGAGRTIGMRTTYKAEILNWAFALKHFGDAPEVREVVQRLADAEARRQKEALAIPGVRVIKSEGV
jgi:soluble cytochrome b562